MITSLPIADGQLIGAAIALAGVVVGQLGAWLLEVNRRRYERKQTAAAVRAELEAIDLLVSGRRYELERRIEALERKTMIDLPRSSGFIPL